ncbi:hypothetical protein [Niallia sp. 03133]|uniref:hypothetical protein n=1 Tax=Niallia sp. 03133 TaxID=3458060 RepID=UPI0040442AA8
MESSVHFYLKQLFQKYKNAKIPNHFTMESIIHHLKEKYQAKEVDTKYYEDLKADPFVDFESIIGMYSITNLNILENLYSEEEKIDIFELIGMNKTIETHPDETENDIVAMWVDVQEGRRINIILESENGCNLSGFTIQGHCQRIFDELSVLQGLEKEECVLGNEKFHIYLKSLVRTGYLS